MPLGRYFWGGIYIHGLLSLYLDAAVLIIFTVILRKSMPSLLGKMGESAVKKQLQMLSPTLYNVFNDLYLPNGRGGTAQIDHVVVSPYGVFVIETKNYSGRIYGKGTDPNWTVVYRGGKKKLRNPFHQNYGHVQSLKHVLGEIGDIPFVSIVCFSKSADVKVSELPKDGAQLVYIREIARTIRGYQDQTISIDKLSHIAGLLTSNRVTEKGVEKHHVERVRANLQAQRNLVQNRVCPKCGGSLVSRRGKYGSFLGCSNFPKCRFKERGA